MTPDATLDILGFEDQIEAAGRFATALAACSGQQVRCRPIHSRRFPDGESLVRLDVGREPPLDVAREPPLCARTFLFCTLGQPNARLVELMLAARTAREHGATQLALIAPYLCYMRQDVAFHPGEAVSQRIVGDFLSTLFDALVTVDPHLHRVASLAEAVPVRVAVNATAAGAIGNFLRQQATRAVLVGPDEESAQWVSQVAAATGTRHAVCTKSRRGDRDVTVTLADDVAGAHVVLIDDIASSGQTLVQAARAAQVAGAIRVDAFVTHAMAGEADVAAMHAAGIANLWSTDSLPHPSNAVALAPLLAAACVDNGLA